MDVEEIAKRLRVAAADGDVLDRARELERLAGAHVRQQVRAQERSSFRTSSLSKGFGRGSGSTS